MDAPGGGGGSHCLRVGGGHDHCLEEEQWQEGRNSSARAQSGQTARPKKA